ncbi:MAG: hypothetical protein IKH46_12325 [Lachnospiraceae bacterium]|nr:hypothetical protein [Lachnospiraceae bacterium]
MVPIPKYLVKNSTLIRHKGNKVIVAFQCDCGSNTFAVARNKLTRAERELLKPYYDALENSLSRYGSWCTEDENGQIHYWKQLSDDQNDVTEVYIPPKPPFATVTVLKAKCTSCGKEHILFDSRINGYDAMTSEDRDDTEYVPHYNIYSKKQYNLEICIENDESLEEFIEATGIKESEEFYSDAFSWIAIYGIDENQKRRKLFDLETA